MSEDVHAKMLRRELAARIAPIVRVNITTRAPYHDAHRFAVGDVAHRPHDAHPAFGNAFDWHSSVHSHWTALRLLEHPAWIEADVGAKLAQAIECNLTPAHLATENAYLASHPSYERPYGWAWAMALATIAPVVRPMAESLASAATKWLAALPAPVRHGVHSNTAFAMTLMLDSARALAYVPLERIVIERARLWFSDDCSWPQAHERSGNDFLSPGLSEAELMTHVLSGDEFAAWWRAFLPELTEDSQILAPVRVPDVADGQIVHLHGLNLSRAATLARIARTLRDAGAGDPSTERLLEHARCLYAASAARASSENYLETHWLPTFAWMAATQLDESCTRRSVS